MRIPSKRVNDSKVALAVTATLPVLKVIFSESRINTIEPRRA